MLKQWRATDIKLVLVVGATLGVIAAIGYVCHSQSAPVVPTSVPAVQTESEQEVQVEADEALPEEPSPLGSVQGYNRPAPPPRGWSIGPPPDDLLDLSTPAVAVYTVLALLDEGRTAKLGPCFLEEPNDPAGDLYPSHLGHPVSLVDVNEDEQAAKVVWQAAVHKAFTRGDKQYSPGETIELTTHLTQVEGAWRLARLHE